MTGLLFSEIKINLIRHLQIKSALRGGSRDLTLQITVIRYNTTSRISVEGEDAADTGSIPELKGGQTCIDIGVGNEVSLQVGGKMDNRHGDPVAIQGKVHLIHDGYFIETEPRHGEQKYHNQGLTAVVAVAGSLVVLTSKRQTPFSLQQLLSLSIDPKSIRVIVVKAAIAYRAAYVASKRRDALRVLC